MRRGGMTGASIRRLNSNSTNSSQGNSPTPTPPTPTPPSICEDSTRPFLVNFRDRTCDWVSKAGTAKRCQKGGGAVATHCPKTCGTCDNCVDAKMRFYLKNGKLKSCEWVAKTNSAKRCKKIGDDSTCRFTCGNCWYMRIVRHHVSEAGGRHQNCIKLLK